MLTETEDILSRWMSKTYNYNSLGQVSSIVYDGSTVNLTENYIYTNGYLTEIKLNNSTSIWKLTAENVFGQPTSVTTGSLARTYEYNAYGLPTRRKVGTLQDFSYNFQAKTGNLSSLTNNKTYNAETFGYDNLNRLTLLDGSTIGYDSKGNITSKPGMGTYVYANSSKPYAVTGVTAIANIVPQRSQTVTYTSFDRPATITENNYKATFTYDASGSRKVMKMEKNSVTEYTRYYVMDKYEFHKQTGKIREKFYLGGDFYTAPAVYVRDNGGNWNIYYICRDYLGSITHITTSSGSVVQELSYDAWGRLRNPSNRVAYAPGSEPELFLGRGYTGHEHLTEFGLINMNARLYDPAVGRFLSPDPYVQAPDFSQSFNRYSYALNNPMKYTDPNGEFIFGFIAGFWKGVFTGKNVFKSAWEGGVNEVKIWAGLFASDPNKNFGGRVWEVISRFTWQLPQTLFGYGFAQISNYAGQVDKVDYWGGATVSSGNNWGSGAVTMGSFITGNRELKADPNNSLFQHEYGHYLQSQEMGWGYLARVGLPSLMSANGDGYHKYQPFEQDANRRAFMYFNENVAGFYTYLNLYEEQRDNGSYINGTSKGWNFYKNPLDVNHTATSGQYYDYYVPSHRTLINSLSLHAKWYDYAGWWIPFGPIYVGIGNGIYYKKHRIK
ncbi:hypothetical protein AGMMS50262_13420 [Bacteroidia bacterium]|nr:hypothetical protein AGMMS50262_13420 [Bacteroidia bacterium]